MKKYKSVKVSPETHLRLKLAATRKGISILSLLKELAAQLGE